MPRPRTSRSISALAGSLSAEFSLLTGSFQRFLSEGSFQFLQGFHAQMEAASCLTGLELGARGIAGRAKIVVHEGAQT